MPSACVAGRVEDRFLVSLATHGLLGLAAEDGGVLCVVDDAQWLDRASADAIVFAGRRLDADGVALLLASRERVAPGCRSSASTASMPTPPPSCSARRSRLRSATGWWRRPAATRSRSWSCRAS